MTSSSWTVDFVVPDANLSAIMRFAVGMSSGLHAGSNLAAIAVEKGAKLLYGGLPMNGTLTVDSGGVSFETSKLADLIAYDRPFSIRIPKAEILGAHVPASFLSMDLTSLGMRPALVVLQTTSGEFRMVAGFRAKRIAAAINDI